MLVFLDNQFLCEIFLATSHFVSTSRSIVTQWPLSFKECEANLNNCRPSFFSFVETLVHHLMNFRYRVTCEFAACAYWCIGFECNLFFLFSRFLSTRSLCLKQAMQNSVGSCKNVELLVNISPNKL